MLGHGNHLFDVIPDTHRLPRALAERPGPLELWRSRVPALSPYAYQKASSSVLAFLREARARDEGKEALLLVFTTPLAKDATIALRKAGFRFSRVMQHWEGLARFDEAGPLAKTHGGTARRVANSASHPGTTGTAEAAE